MTDARTGKNGSLIAKQSPITEEYGVSLSMAMIALGSNARPSAAAIQADLAKQWPSLPKAKPSEAKEGRFAFRIGSLDIIGGLMPAPIPWSDLEELCAASRLWKEATEVMRTHTTHLILTVLGEAGPMDRIKLLTQVTASILATCPEAVGVYWTEAGLVIQPSLFRDFATRVLPLGPPLDIWVDFRIAKSKSGKSVGFTRGMQSLGHMEFETKASPEPPSELRKRFIGLAHYVLEHGPVIRDGDTMGEDANERIRIIYAKSSFGHDKKVMRLKYQSSDKKDSRDKLTTYGYIHLIVTIAITIGFGMWLHSALAGMMGAFLRHVVLDIPILIFGFIFLLQSDLLLQKMFGLEAWAPSGTGQEAGPPRRSRRRRR